MKKQEERAALAVQYERVKELLRLTRATKADILEGGKYNNLHCVSCVQRRKGN